MMDDSQSPFPSNGVLIAWKSCQQQVCHIFSYLESNNKYMFHIRIIVYLHKPSPYSVLPCYGLQ